MPPQYNNLNGSTDHYLDTLASSLSLAASAITSVVIRSATTARPPPRSSSEPAASRPHPAWSPSPPTVRTELQPPQRAPAPRPESEVDQPSEAHSSCPPRFFAVGHRAGPGLPQSTGWSDTEQRDHKHWERWMLSSLVPLTRTGH